MDAEKRINIGEILIEDGTDSQPEPVFGLAFRAVNYWNREAIESTGTLGIDIDNRQMVRLIREMGQLSQYKPELRSWQGANQSLREAIESINPRLWQEIEGIDMGNVENWQRLANVIGQPYHITIYSKHYIEHDLDKYGTFIQILNGVVVPQNSH